jgi:hypothetical protein
LIAALFSIFGNVLFIKSYGAVGAAWASGGALALGSCLAGLSVRRRLGFWPIPHSGTAVQDVISLLRPGIHGLSR